MAPSRPAFWTTIVLSSLIFSPSLKAQDTARELQQLYSELDSLFEEEAFPSRLFELADSILALEKVKISALHIRAGYVSEVVSAGRSFGMEQYGFIPAVTYYHHSGVFGGATGYWSNEFEPGYYLTDLSIGYLYTFKKKLNLMASHSFYIYNDTLESHLFNKSIEGTVNYQGRFADAGVSYAFLYGNSQANRITANANFRWKLKLDGLIEAITFMPGISGQWGNADVFYWRQPRTAITDLYHLVNNNDYPRLTRRDYIRLHYLLENNRELAAAYFLNQRNYSPDQISDLLDKYYDGEILSEDTFGFMNFSISCPVIIRSGRFNLLVNYTYNMPQALPGENFTYDPAGYFSASLSYTLSWMKK